MKYYLGIDGGGTKTVAAVSDENGNILLKEIGRTINFYSVGMDSARNNLKNILVEAEKAGISQFEGAFIGCSALDDEADAELTAKLCEGIINAKKIRMHSDVYIALKSVEDANCPCVAICGTGSMAIAEDKEGILHITGGWGHILGDEGSAYSIALRALKHCCRMCDKGEISPLLESANKYFNVTDFRKAIEVIYSPVTTKDILAGFAKSVSEIALSGDTDALEILRTEAELFADTVLILLEDIQCCDVLGLYGGMFLHSKLFVTIFSDKIKEKYPYLKIRLLDIPPEESAVKLAREL